MPWLKESAPFAIFAIHDVVAPQSYHQLSLHVVIAFISQVLAGALQDNKRAVIAGERTFGKGLIQTVVALSDGERF